MPNPLRFPADGLPDVLSTPAEFAHAATRLSKGFGPVAVDTERASSFRFDDRAFFIQLRRRGVGTLLLAPEGNRKALTKHLAPVLNKLEWVIHSAPSDMPSLLALGLYPTSLVDTEKAARLAGFPQPNLARLVSDVLGLELAKGHGREDWSTTPLPKDWVIYAALDVEVLLELGEALIELLANTQKLDWAEQEFRHILASFPPRRHHRTGDVLVTPLPTNHWRDIKGIGTLHSQQQLAIARALWRTRDRICQTRDIAPNRVLRNKDLIALAQAAATTPAAAAAAIGITSRNSKAARWSTVAAKALQQDAKSWPKPAPHNSVPFPSQRHWNEEYPQVMAFFTAARGALEAAAEELNVPLECIISMNSLRNIAWECVEVHGVCHAEIIAGVLESYDARPWQIDLIIGVLCGHPRPFDLYLGG